MTVMSKRIGEQGAVALAPVKVADYIADFIARLGVTHVFTVSGAGDLHILDAIHRHKDLDYICNHHEQASALGMFGYARARNDIGVCMVTTGPGATNAITGVCSTWVDSVPGLILSGQVKRADMINGSGVRQRGIQEINIIDMVAPVTKFAALVEHPEDIRFLLEKAVYIAKSGRPGPVWLDIPMDVQAAKVQPELLRSFVPDAPVVADDLSAQAEAAAVMLRQATRPVVLVGHGVRLSGAADAFRALVERLNIPVMTTWNGIDLIESDHPLYVGRPGSYGQRGANFAIQNCDFLLTLGTRLSIPQTGYDDKLFARAAKKVLVDIDPFELGKFTFVPDLPVVGDAHTFIRAFERATADDMPFAGTSWLEHCRRWRDAYPSCLPSYRQAGQPVNSFDFVDALSDQLRDGDLIVPTASGSGFTSSHQALKIKRGQRCFTSNGFAEMGFDIPGAIGACIGFDKRRIVTMTGDGGVQMNIQELQTLAHYRLPVKLFIFCNRGYLTIRQTQDNMFAGHYSGSHPESGVSLPDYVKVAEAYGIQAFRIDGRDDLESGIAAVLASDGPAVCAVTMQAAQALVPKMSFRITETGQMVSPPLEDLFPFLPRDEFRANMLIPTVEV